LKQLHHKSKTQHKQQQTQTNKRSRKKYLMLVRSTGYHKLSTIFSLQEY